MPDINIEQDYLDQSDEDFLKQPVPTAATADEVTDLVPSDDTPEEVPVVAESEDLVPTPPVTVEAKGSNGDASLRAEPEAAAVTEGGEAQPEPLTPEKVEAPEESLKKLFAPFKASGVEMQVNSVDEAIKLMQMGVDYQKKSQKLSQHRRTLDTLKKHQVGDNELSLAIDALKGSKEAIGKLIADHNITYEDLFDREGAEAYVPPTDLLVDQKEASLNEVYESLQSSQHFQQIDRILREDWDVESAKTLVDNPSFLTELDSDMKSGQYSQIMQHFNHVKTFGNPDFQGMNDLQLYCAIGTRLFSQNNTQVAQANQPALLPQQTPVIAPRPTKPATQPQASVKKVAPTTQSHSNSQPTQASYLDMPDDAFRKIRG